MIRLIQFVKHRKIDFLLRVVATYLILWWTLFFLLISEAVEVLPASFLPFARLFPVLYVAHIGLWLSTTKTGKQFKWLLFMIFALSSLFHLTLAILKGLPAYKVGTVIYVIATAYVFSWKPENLATRD